MLSFLYSVCWCISLGSIIFGVNVFMFSLLFPLKILLPDRFFWRIIKYCFTQLHWKWVLYRWGKIKVHYEGESSLLPKGEAAIMIANHQDDLDFGICILAYMENGILSSQTKWVSKNVVAFVPLIGWVHWLIGDLFLKRSWEKDMVRIKEWLSKFHERQFKRIVIFPEGTRSRDKKKLAASQEFARNNELPVLNNVLYPRTKGFSLIAKYFRDNPGTVDYVYDYTFGYYPESMGLEDFAQGPIPVDIHIYISRHRLADIGKDESEFAAWCVQRFQVKDRMLQYFAKHKRFPTVQEAATMEKLLKKELKETEQSKEAN